MIALPAMPYGQPKVIEELADPVVFQKLFWPQFTLYDKQREIMYSVRDNYETVVPAAHDMGKDFVSAMIVLWFFASRRPCMIMTTGPSFGQLDIVLWGEIRRLLNSARYKLPIRHNRTTLFQVMTNGNDHPQSIVDAKVVQKDESITGMHIPRTAKNEPTTLLIADESSGVAHEPYMAADSWTHRKLAIGNPYQCNNFFFQGVEEGNQESKRSTTGMENLYRNVIHIRGEDSPNVRLGREEEKGGKKPSHTTLIPGVLSYADYLQRRETWDPMKQCAGIDAEFYKGKELYLFPPEWRKHSWELHQSLSLRYRVATGIGVDPAEGGDSTTYAAVDEYGLIELVSVKTPNTSVITGETLAFMQGHGLSPDIRNNCLKVCFDRGGGGKQHADRMRNEQADPSINGGKQYPVRTVGFGGPATDEEKQDDADLHGYRSPELKRDTREQRYVYVNKRAELYGRLSLRMDPSTEETKFAIPPRTAGEPYKKLNDQLKVIPRVYDESGKLRLPPKRKKQNSNEVSLEELIGYSPDEADAVCLAVYATEVKQVIESIGALF